jgi:hypothetical protein
MAARVGLVHFHVGQLEVEQAALRHRIAGVDGEVHDHLLHLGGIGAHAAEGAAAASHQLDVFADQALEERAHALDDLAEVQDARLQHLLAAEGEELMGEGEARSAARPISWRLRRSGCSIGPCAGRARCGRRSR